MSNARVDSPNVVNMFLVDNLYAEHILSICPMSRMYFSFMCFCRYEHLAPSIPGTLEPKHLRQSHPSLNSRTGPGTL